MKTNYLGLITGCLLLFVSGCCACNRAEWPDPPVVDHMGVSQKRVYMENLRQNLLVFRTTLADIQKHEPEPLPDEPPSCDDKRFPCEVYKYVEVYAMPILFDEEALSNPETRLGVARINLLSAYALYEAKHYGMARKLIRLFEKQYGEDAAVLGALEDSGDMGFATLDEGLKTLKRKLALG